MSKEPVVRLKNVTKKIGKRTIVDKLNFDVYPGEVFGFLGPNGAGKTTTIRMMMGLISITEGEILINGYSITKDFEKAISKVGGIVENPEMYKYLTGYQNLMQYANMYTNVSRENVIDIAESVGLGKRVNDKVKTYSLGMRQRLGLAQALLHSPSLLVLDEPTNGLDPAGIKELRNYLRDLAQQKNIAVFVSSHLLSEMELMCDRIGIIDNGKLIEIQNVNEFLQDNDTPVAFEVEPVSQAAEIISAHLGRNDLNVTGNSIEASVKRDDIPEIVNKLVHNNIKVYGINNVTKTLEDKFLEVTGGSEIA